MGTQLQLKVTQNNKGDLPVNNGAYCFPPISCRSNSCIAKPADVYREVKPGKGCLVSQFRGLAKCNLVRGAVRYMTGIYVQAWTPGAASSLLYADKDSVRCRCVVTNQQRD